MLPFVQGEFSVLVCCGRRIKSRIEWDGRKRQKGGSVGLEQFRYETSLAVLVVFTPHIQIAGLQQLFILGWKALEFRHWDKLIAAEVPDLILDISLFPSGFRVHEYRSETVMFGKPPEPVRYLTAAPFYDARNDSTGIIEPDLRRDAPDVFKHRNEAFQQAFCVFTIVQLEVASVAVRETQDQVFSFLPEPAVFPEISSAKVCLCLTGLMYQRNVPFLLRHMQPGLLFRDIFGYKPVAATVSFCFLFKAPVYSFCSMALLPWSFPVLFKPLVDQRFEWVQL